MTSTLYIAPRSPFARKILVAAAEMGLQNAFRVALIDPWTDETLRRLNPLCKVPTLARDGEPALFDSVAIADYLDHCSGGRLIPSGARRWDALRRQALGDGLADAVIRRHVECLGSCSESSARVVARQESAIRSALDSLEVAPGWMAEPLDIGHIAIAVALNYLDGRSPELGWAEGRSALSRWFLGFCERPSIRAAFSPDLDGFDVDR